MFSWFKKNWNNNIDIINTTQEKKVTAFIRPVGTKHGLFDSQNNVIGMYSRKRDAVRGATRRGLQVA